MKKFLTIAIAALLTIIFCACTPVDPINESQPLPELLKEQTFIYDELETDKGNSLYTLSFNENSYVLYQDNGIGILSAGKAETDDSRTLKLTDGENTLVGKYTGGVFEATSVILNYGGKQMTFVPATDTAEYVYLSYLGVFCGDFSGRECFLIFERWSEFYLYTNNNILCGSYDIYDDGKVKLYTDGAAFSGTVNKGNSNGNFDITKTTLEIAVTINEKSENVKFTYAQSVAEYSAAHAMGTYTLSLYGNDVFAIHGVDGFVKALGTLETSNGQGVTNYFPRNITNKVELSDNFNVSFTYDDDIMVFPDNTKLLPRSGNISVETGYGSYWVAGTPLEFIRKAKTDDDFTTVYSLSGNITDENGEPVADAAVYIDGVDTGERSAKDGGFNLNGLKGAHCVAFKKDGCVLDFFEVNKDNNILNVTCKDGEPGVSHFPEGSSLEQSMPSVGIARPLVLLIDFPDYHRPRFVSAEGIQSALFDISAHGSLSAFYYRSSYGNLNISGKVLDWYRAKKNRSEYSSDKELMTEAINYYISNEGLDLADYDADGDGNIDSLYVLWAGTLDDDGTWSVAYRAGWSSSPAEWGVKVGGYIFVPGSTVWSSVPPLVCNVNSLTHETGHLLGLNDYYSYDTAQRNGYTGGALEGGLGGMDMMDANIGDHNAYSKWLLGWINPEVVEFEDISSLTYDTSVYTLRPSNEQGDALFVKLKSSDSLHTELFVIEVISPQLNASEFTRLKQPVVRILHVESSVDEGGLSGNFRGYGFRYDNSYTTTKFISILEADGQDTVLNFVPSNSYGKISYDVNDCFKEGDEVTPYGYPNTNAYDVYGNATVFTGLCIKIESIDENGTAVIRLGYEQEEETLKLTSVSPNPVIVPYTDAPIRISAETKRFTFTFNYELQAIDDKSLSAINVYSGNTRVEGWAARVDGRNLYIEFDNCLLSATDYTVVIPQGTFASAGGVNLINNFNGIFGFLTE